MRIHGHTRPPSPTYRSWQKAKERCFNVSHKFFFRYGGRGITMCPQWTNNFSKFLEDMGERPEGTTLDRKDNNKGYEPGNCVWSTKSAQARNTPRNIHVYFQGKKYLLIELCEEKNLPYWKIKQRIQRNGWTIEEALL